MKKKFILIIAFIAVSSLIYAGSKTLKLKIAAGFKGGTYSEISTSLKKVPGLKVKMKNTKGSIENIKLVAAKKADLGITQLDILLNNMLVPDSTKEKLRVIFPIYREEVHILASDKVKNMEDLEGRTITIGSSDSGTNGSARIILAALKILKKVKLDETDTIKGLKKLESGQTDVVFLVAGTPVDILKKPLKGVKLLAIEGNTLKFLTSDFFPYRQSVIKKSSYGWLNTDVKTISVASVFIVNAKMKDADVEKLISGIFEHKFDLVKSHSKWSELDAEYTRSILESLGEVSHPAAIKAAADLK